MATSSKSSVCSTRSGKSSASSTSAARARARAEAAKVRASYASQEAKLKMEKATRAAQNQLETVRIDTELEVLTLQREADAAAVEAQVLEDAELAMHGAVERGGSESEKVKIERTSEYVNSQINLQNHSPSPLLSALPVAHVDSHNSFITWSPAVKDIKHAQSTKNKPKSEKADSMHLPATYLSDLSEGAIKSEVGRTSPIMNTPAKPYIAQYIPLASTPPQAEPLAQYLARRDLVNSGLYQFDDKPENYRSWYSSFTSAAREVHLTATQELDLMTKWLGKESGEMVKRIRSVHVNNPNLALHKAWERLRECYAAPEIIERSLFQRLDSFPRFSAKDHTKLRELGDLLMEIQGAKEDGYLTGLSYLDTSRGIAPIIDKLPYGLQDKWVTTGSCYKEGNYGRFPPFEYFCNFVCYEAKKRNDPSFMHQSSVTTAKPDRSIVKSFQTNKPISVHKTDVCATNDDPNKICPLHNKPHPLKKCRTFRNKPLDVRKAFLKEKGICFKCCSSISHLAKECKSSVKCSECGSNYHDVAMHPGPSPQAVKAPSPSQEDGGEGEDNSNNAVVNTSCTEVCGPSQWGRSCSKICLVKLYPEGSKDMAIKAYVILDDQSNRSLARPEFFELFNVESEQFSYHLRTCSGIIETSGKKAEGFQIESLDGKVLISLPPLIECHEIMNNRSEIPTPSAVLYQPHLRHIAKHIPELEPEAEILLLLGRDVIRAHKVRQQVNGPNNAPFAQRLDLGWVVIGEVCLGNVHRPTVNTFKTNVLESGRYSIFQPCTSFMQVKEMQQSGSTSSKATEKTLGQTVFSRTEHDNKPAPSVEDTVFLKIMDTNVYRNDANSWVAPLPFREPRRRLPNNKEVVHRFTCLQRTLKRKPEMHQQYVAFMEKIFTNGHAEVAPPLSKEDECWYLPTFGVYHPQKPKQIRVVFDSSARCSDISLNDVLLTGPDLNNSLVGVLLRFRKERVAILADIQQMFHCFLVRDDHRNFLRFLWHKDNDVNKEIIEYRMKVHVFGNRPSPAVAIYGLRRAIREGAQEYGADTVKFVERCFYVDDGLVSVPSEAEAIDLLQRTQASLAESNLRLHKFASNSQTVIEAFPLEDCAPVIKDLDLSGETSPTQRSLGLLWEITTDTFTYSASTITKPFTRRGVLSTVNSVFDPLGLVAPVTIQGRALLRELTSEQSDWDTILPKEKLSKWEAWRDSLQDLEQLHVPRTYTTTSLIEAVHTELCVFSDASTKAIGAVAYLKALQKDGQVEVGFVMGKAKLAPLSEPTIPRLELCAAVLAVEMADLIKDELDLELNDIKFFTDSKVVLGYIYNESKRFYVYVHNRVQRIHQSSKPEQWHYVRTEENPADHASRSLPASRLAQTSWFTGPSFLRQPPAEETQITEAFELIEPESDLEIRPQIQTCATNLEEPELTSNRFQRFSTFTSLVRGVAFLVHMAKSFKHTNQNSKCKGWHRCDLPRTPDEIDQARNVVLKATQKDAFAKELSALQANQTVSKTSCLRKLSPIMEDNFICVGGRLKYSEVTTPEKNPIILPKDSHVSLLLIRHHHEQVKHQGRHLTEGAIRAAGLWILGGKSLINSVLHKCITCRKLRGKFEEQYMADLPSERLKVCPPFTYVGLDVFGPWSVTSRRTRGGQAENKRWAIMFCCMSSRAVHIEIIESMDTSSCINALRRFFALRGSAKQLHSDCGTNFIGACKELGMDKTVQRYLSEQGCSWEFNPPHSSHMGGSWERLIGIARRILDSMFLQLKTRLTHEVLCTLMAEVTAIINARPLLPVSADPEQPFILSPSVLLTQKTGVPPPPGDFSDKDLYTKQWRQVQALANQFWTRWSREYLPCLQHRQKWTVPRRNLQVGDLVLLRDKQVARNCWPMARISAVYPGKDGHTDLETRFSTLSSS
ncbi:Paraneoplastic antigen-like protein 5 [Labeo rohita]|uniref:Paraneoplastic antigen-like protein 5 n=1 Tax=Labeo rohita TaxID=84645 RepID=A0ABQ8L294_LABRO|nr:Paraneoplastic antigen-like protein 5 [Labeo rohita]